MERIRVSKNPLHLFFAVTGLILLSAFITLVPPDSFVPIGIFFVLLASAVVLFSLYLGGSIRRSLVIAAGIVLYLLLRMLGLKHPLYFLLMIACIIALEYLWKDTTV
jgi:preprotein translocase subunit SecY